MSFLIINLHLSNWKSIITINIRLLTYHSNFNQMLWLNDIFIQGQHCFIIIIVFVIQSLLSFFYLWATRFRDTVRYDYQWFCLFEQQEFIRNVNPKRSKDNNKQVVERDVQTWSCSSAVCFWKSSQTTWRTRCSHTVHKQESTYSFQDLPSTSITLPSTAIQHPLICRVQTEAAPSQEPLCTNLQYCTNSLFVILGYENTPAQKWALSIETRMLFSLKIKMEKAWYFPPLRSPPPTLGSHMCLPRPAPGAIDWVFRVLSHSVYYSSAVWKTWLDTQTKLSLKLPLSLPVTWKQHVCWSHSSRPEEALVSCVWVNATLNIKAKH